MFYYVLNLDIIDSDFQPSQLIDSDLNYLNWTINESKIEKIFSKIENYKFSGQSEINGFSVKLNESQDDTIQKTFFKLRFGSGLAFIQTDKENEELNTIDMLNVWFNNSIKITKFIPRRDRIIDLILNSDDYGSIKLLTERGIKPLKESEDINDMKNELSSYPLVEADLEFTIIDDIINFYFYGDAIQFPPSVESEQIEKILQIFENIMSENGSDTSNTVLNSYSKCVNHVF